MKLFYPNIEVYYYSMMNQCFNENSIHYNPSVDRIVEPFLQKLQQYHTYVLSLPDANKIDHDIYLKDATGPYARGNLWWATRSMKAKNRGYRLTEQPAFLIKKYKNRKLYNTKDGCYITLTIIAEMVERGENFVVINHLTENITNETLAQIMSIKYSSAVNMLPERLLKYLIQQDEQFFSALLLQASKATLVTR